MEIKVYKDIIAEIGRPNRDSNSFVFLILRVSNINVAHESQIYNFVELLSAFVSNQLHSNKEYQLDYKGISGSKGGYVAKIVSQQNQKFLQVVVDNKKYYFEKYECRIITKILNKILSKCTFMELV
ncbi:MAG: hypothetical protein ACI81I_000294 [Arcobacteraceae bacterium]|jgi:hypothetical protein